MPVVRAPLAPPGIYVEGPGTWVAPGHAVFADIVGSNSWTAKHSPDDPDLVDVSLTVHGDRDQTIRYKVDLSKCLLSRTMLALLPESAILPSATHILKGYGPGRKVLDDEPEAAPSDGLAPQLGPDDDDGFGPLFS